MRWIAVLAIAGMVVVGGIVLAVVLATRGGSASEAPSQPSTTNRTPDRPHDDPSDHHRSATAKAPPLEAGRWFVSPSADSAGAFGANYKDNPSEPIVQADDPPDDTLLRLVAPSRPDLEAPPNDEDLEHAQTRLRHALTGSASADEVAKTAARVLAHSASLLCRSTPEWIMQLLSTALDVASGAAGELTLQRDGDNMRVMDQGETLDSVPVSTFVTVSGVPIPAGIRWGACVTSKGAVLPSRSECFVHWASLAGSCRL